MFLLQIKFYAKNKKVHYGLFFLLERESDNS